MDLVLFNDCLEHLTRVHRLLRLPRYTFFHSYTTHYIVIHLHFCLFEKSTVENTRVFRYFVM